MCFLLLFVIIWLLREYFSYIKFAFLCRLRICLVNFYGGSGSFNVCNFFCFSFSVDICCLFELCAGEFNYARLFSLFLVLSYWISWEFFECKNERWSIKPWFWNGFGCSIYKRSINGQWLQKRDSFWVNFEYFIVLYGFWLQISKFIR